MARNKLDFTYEDTVGGVEKGMDLVETAARRVVAFVKVQREHELDGARVISSNQLYARLNNVVRDTIEEKGVTLAPEPEVRTISSPANTFSNIASYVTAYYLTEMDNVRENLTDTEKDMMEVFTSAHPVELNLASLYEDVSKAVIKGYREQGEAYGESGNVYKPGFFIPALRIAADESQTLNVEDMGSAKVDKLDYTEHSKYMHFYTSPIEIDDVAGFSAGNTIANICRNVYNEVNDMDVPGVDFAWEETGVNRYTGRPTYGIAGLHSVEAGENVKILSLAETHNRIYEELEAGKYSELRQEYFEKNPEGNLYDLSLQLLKRETDYVMYGIGDGLADSSAGRDSLLVREFNTTFEGAPAVLLDSVVIRDKLVEQIKENGFGAQKLPELGTIVYPGRLLPEYDEVRTNINSRLREIRGKAFDCSCDVSKGIDIRNEISAHMPTITVNHETYRIPVEDTLVNVYNMQYNPETKKYAVVSKVPTAEYIANPEKYPRARVTFANKIDADKVDTLALRVINEIYTDENIREQKVMLGDSPYLTAADKVVASELAQVSGNSRYIVDDASYNTVADEADGIGKMRGEYSIDVGRIQREIEKSLKSVSVGRAFNDDTPIMVDDRNVGTISGIMNKYFEHGDGKGDYVNEGSGYKETAAKAAKDAVDEIIAYEKSIGNFNPVIVGQVDESYKDIIDMDLMPVMDEIRKVVRDCRENPDKYPDATVTENGWTEGIPGKFITVGSEGAKYQVVLPLEFESEKMEDTVVFTVGMRYLDKFAVDFGTHDNMYEFNDALPFNGEVVMFTPNWERSEENSNYRTSAKDGLGRDVVFSIRMQDGTVFKADFEKYPDKLRGFNPEFFKIRKERVEGSNMLNFVAVPRTIAPKVAYALHKNYGIPYGKVNYAYEAARIMDARNLVVRDADLSVNVKATNALRRNSGFVFTNEGKVDIAKSNEIRKANNWKLIPVPETQAVIIEKKFNKEATDRRRFEDNFVKMTDSDFKRYMVKELLPDNYNEIKEALSVKGKGSEHERVLRFSEAEMKVFDQEFRDAFADEVRDRFNAENMDTRDVNAGKEYAGTDYSQYRDIYGEGTFYIPCETEKIRKMCMVDSNTLDTEVSDKLKEMVESSYGMKNIADGKTIALKNKYAPYAKGEMLLDVLLERHSEMLNDMKAADIKSWKVPVMTIFDKIEPAKLALGNFYSSFPTDAFDRNNAWKENVYYTKESICDAALGVELRLAATRLNMMETEGKTANEVNALSDKEVISNGFVKYLNTLSTQQVLDVVVAQNERLGNPGVSGTRFIGRMDIKEKNLASPEVVTEVVKAIRSGKIFADHKLRFNSNDLNKQLEEGNIKLTNGEAMRILEGRNLIERYCSGLGKDEIAKISDINDMRDFVEVNGRSFSFEETMAKTSSTAELTSAQIGYLKYHMRETDLEGMSRQDAKERIEAIETKLETDANRNFAPVEDVAALRKAGFDIKAGQHYSQADLMKDLKTVAPFPKSVAEVSRRCLEGKIQEIRERNGKVTEFDYRSVIEHDNKNLIFRNNGLVSDEQKAFAKRFEISEQEIKKCSFGEAHDLIVNTLQERGVITNEDAAYLKGNNVSTVDMDKLYAVKNTEKSLQSMSRAVHNSCENDRMLERQYLVDTAEISGVSRSVTDMAYTELKAYQKENGRLLNLDPVKVAEAVADKLVRTDFAYKDGASEKETAERLDKDFVDALRKTLPVDPVKKGVSIEAVVIKAREKREAELAARDNRNAEKENNKSNDSRK